MYSTPPFLEKLLLSCWLLSQFAADLVVQTEANNLLVFSFPWVKRVVPLAGVILQRVSYGHLFCMLCWLIRN
jgi:hypothetical protein